MHAVFNRNRELDAEIARGIACGNLDPITKKPFVLESIVENAIRTVGLLLDYPFLTFLTKFNRPMGHGRNPG